MAILEIDGLLGGKRLRRCSGAARWHFGYYLLLANGYARIELDYEAIAEHFVSFRDTAPTPQSVRDDFSEYQKEHLVFVYSFGGRTWAQFDTKRSNTKHHKTAVDRRSPHPPEAGYQQWLKEQHPDDWGLYHWSSMPESSDEQQVPQNQEVIKSSEDFKEVEKTFEDLPRGVGVGVGLGVGEGDGNKTRSKPSKRTSALALKSDIRFSHCADILHRYWNKWSKGIRFELWFDGAGGTQLNNSLKRHKAMTVEEFTTCVANRARSPGINHNDPFYLWGGHILEWAAGPKGVNGNGRGQQQAGKGDAKEQRIIERAIKYRTDAARETNSQSSDSMAISGDGATGVHGLGDEPEIMPPGKS